MYAYMNVKKNLNLPLFSSLTVFRQKEEVEQLCWNSVLIFYVLL